MNETILVAVAVIVASGAVVTDAWAQDADQMWAYAGPWLAQSFAFGSILMWLFVVVASAGLVFGAYTFISRWVTASSMNQARNQDNLFRYGRQDKDNQAASGSG